MLPQYKEIIKQSWKNNRAACSDPLFTAIEILLIYLVHKIRTPLWFGLAHMMAISVINTQWVMPSNTASLRCFICTIPKIRQENLLGFQWVHETARNFPDKEPIACNTTEWTPHTGFSTVLWHSLQSRENPEQDPHCICRSCAPAAPIPCALPNQNHSPFPAG